MKMILASEFSVSFPVTKGYIEKYAKGKKCLFIPTAAYGDNNVPAPEHHQDLLKEMGFEIEELDLVKSTVSETRDKVMGADIVHVTGGNTFHLLDSANKTDFKNILESFFEKDGLYVGSSAGSIIMCPDIQFIAPMDHPERAPDLYSTKSFGLINFAFMPHYNLHSEYAAACEILIKHISNSSQVPVIPLNDEQAVFVDSDKIEFLSV